MGDLIVWTCDRCRTSVATYNQPSAKLCPVCRHIDASRAQIAALEARLAEAEKALAETSGPGTPTARWRYLMASLESRIPDQRPWDSTTAPEDRYLAEIDRLAARVKELEAEKAQWEATWHDACDYELAADAIAGVPVAPRSDSLTAEVVKIIADRDRLRAEAGAAARSIHRYKALVDVERVENATLNYFIGVICRMVDLNESKVSVYQILQRVAKLTGKDLPAPPGAAPSPPDVNAR